MKRDFIYITDYKFSTTKISRAHARKIETGRKSIIQT